jgi:hypothetical protein
MMLIMSAALKSAAYASILHSFGSIRLDACIFLRFPLASAQSSDAAWFAYRTSTTLFNFSMVLNAAS